MDINDVKQVLRGPMIPELSCLDSNLAVDHGATRANVQTTVERGIVHGAVFIARKISNVHHFQRPRPVLQALSDEARTEWPGKHLRE